MGRKAFKDSIYLHLPEHSVKNEKPVSVMKNFLFVVDMSAKCLFFIPNLYVYFSLQS